MELRRSILMMVLIILAMTIDGLVVRSQNLLHEQRGMHPKEYVKTLPRRISSSRLKSKPVKKKGKLPQYFQINSNEKLITGGIEVGITFWQLQKAIETDSKYVVEERSRTIVRENGEIVKSVEYLTPVRVHSNFLFRDGDLIRLGLEIPVFGYIYVFNREQFIDGSFGSVSLIFPNIKDISYTDRTTPGKLLYLPNIRDHFAIKSSSEDKKKIAEILYIVIAPKPLETVPALNLSEEQRLVDSNEFEKMQKEWSKTVWIFGKEEKGRVAITESEKQASLETTRLLTQYSAFPQTIYHIEYKTGDTILFTVPIKIGK